MNTESNNRESPLLKNDFAQSSIDIDKNNIQETNRYKAFN